MCSGVDLVKYGYDYCKFFRRKRAMYRTVDEGVHLCATHNLRPPWWIVLTLSSSRAAEDQLELPPALSGCLFTLHHTWYLGLQTGHWPYGYRRQVIIFKCASYCCSIITPLERPSVKYGNKTRTMTGRADGMNYSDDTGFSLGRWGTARSRRVCWGYDTE
ncbi:unnamed protein product [Nesidiocoris tenuis]|uniref:Uncharacterized protein n=1 Tax=Nesidiocoris tenuis TaxID=355587 RepID=A0A6H5HLF2_9HEMI|nr:unnamed protein product [Nesidiocoris tenuis]